MRSRSRAGDIVSERSDKECPFALSNTELAPSYLTFNMNTQKITLYVLLVLIGAAGGYFLSHPAGKSDMAMQSATMNGKMDMEAQKFDVPAGQPAPTVSLQPFPDSESGWNLHIVTTNFTFDPANVGGDAAPGHGHVHVLVDGQMVGRAYSDWYYLPALTPGKHTITVELETNDHMDYYVNGKQVMASVDITQGSTATTAAPKEFDLSVKSGKVVSGSGDIQVMQGDTVKLVVTNDSDNELHLHGYNIMTDLKAGQPGTITFQASASGRFPFELEETKQELGAVSVMPQ